MINNATTESTKIELPKEAVQYTLCGNGNLRFPVMYLNGKALTLGENDELPCLCGKEVAAGEVELAPCTCTFFVL